MTKSTDQLVAACETFLNQLNSCKMFERGAGGMSIEAQAARTELIGVKLNWVTDFEEVFYEYQLAQNNKDD